VTDRSDPPERPDLADGSYDAVVVDATAEDDGWCRVELTLLAGAHKGEVVAVRARGLAAQSLDLLGIPATLVVEDGTPSVTFEL
jgi:hypothetical protein